MAFTTILVIAFFANAAPAVVWEILRMKPGMGALDFGHSFLGRRIFGDHKTIGGTLIVLFTAGLCAENLHGIERAYDIPLGAVSVLGVAWGPAMARAFAIGIGVVLGDLLGSFLKRRIGLVEGAQAYLLDWCDWIVGAIAAAYLVGIALPPWPVLLGLCGAFALLQASCDVSARRIGIRR